MQIEQIEEMYKDYQEWHNTHGYKYSQWLLRNPETMFGMGVVTDIICQVNPKLDEDSVRQMYTAYMFHQYLQDTEQVIA